MDIRSSDSGNPYSLYLINALALSRMFWFIFSSWNRPGMRACVEPELYLLTTEDIGDHDRVSAWQDSGIILYVH